MATPALARALPGAPRAPEAMPSSDGCAALAPPPRRRSRPPRLLRSARAAQQQQQPHAGPGRQRRGAQKQRAQDEPARLEHEREAEDA